MRAALEELHEKTLVLSHLLTEALALLDHIKGGEPHGLRGTVGTARRLSFLIADDLLSAIKGKEQ